LLFDFLDDVFLTIFFPKNPITDHLPPNTIKLSTFLQSSS
jgi:hypothetical protein